MSREIYIKRKNRLVGGGLDWDIYLDGKRLGYIINNHSLTFNLDSNEHSMHFQVKEPTANGGTRTVRSNTVIIPAGNKSFSYLLYSKTGLLTGHYLIKEIIDKTTSDINDIDQLINAQKR